MLKIENYEVVGWEHAARGMRNPMNSWEKGDTRWTTTGMGRDDICLDSDYEGHFELLLGPNDQDLMMRLRNAGTDHRKYMRMITVYLDITAPLYWWKEFDTYKVGTVANSCSTMHKIHSKEFTMEDFSTEHLLPINVTFTDYTLPITNVDMFQSIINVLNAAREKYLETKDKAYWWQMIQLLPSSYNQRRTIKLNYEVLANIYKSRRNHKLDEWHVLCDWIESLPYSEIITAAKPETSFWDDAVAVMNDMTDAQKEEAIKYLKEKLGQPEAFYICDKTIHSDCSYECKYTSDVTHAVNFEEISSGYFEKEKENDV